MSTTLLSSGSASFAEIALGAGSYTRISLLEYASTFQKTMMQSGAAWRLASGVNSIRRLKGPYIQDVPVVSLELSFEPEEELLASMFKLLKESRNERIKVRFQDPASKIDWAYPECYLQSFSFQVSENTILAVNLSLFVRMDEVHYSRSKRTSIAGGENRLPLKRPIPYYAWKLESDFDLEEVRAFNFSFTQAVTPKYGTVGSAASAAPAFSHVLFGLPAIEFGVTQVMHGSYDIDFRTDRNGTQHNLDRKLAKNDVEVKVRGRTLFRLTGLAVQEEAPAFDAGIPSHNIKFSVHGTLA